MVKKAIGNRHEARERKEKERCRVGFWAVRGQGRKEEVKGGDFVDFLDGAW